MKYGERTREAHAAAVALFTRAWIEIYNLAVAIYLSFVALFTRAWIEIP